MKSFSTKALNLAVWLIFASPILLKATQDHSIDRKKLYEELKQSYERLERKAKAGRQVIEIELQDGNVEHDNFNSLLYCIRECYSKKTDELEVCKCNCNIERARKLMSYWRLRVNSNEICDERRLSCINEEMAKKKARKDLLYERIREADAREKCEEIYVECQKQRCKISDTNKYIQ